MQRLELIPLFSGSSGNSTLIRTTNTNILIDAGRNCKQVCLALERVGTDPSSIDAVFITHSHYDHIDALDVFCRKYPVKIYATEPTHAYFSRKCSKPHPMSEDIIITDGQEIRLDPDTTIKCCATPHDSRGSVCYRITSGDKSCMVMTDLGYVTDDIRAMAEGVDGILIEANYDPHMLVYGPYPEDLKVRIAGDYGHMSNVACAEMVTDLIASGTKQFILGHLSENNNTHEKAFSTVVDYQAGKGLVNGRDFFLRVASRYEPTEAMVL